MANALARWLDGRFVDPLLGLLLPGVGDLIGAALGLYPIALAWRRKAPKVLLARMLAQPGGRRRRRRDPDPGRHLGLPLPRPRPQRRAPARARQRDRGPRPLVGYAGRRRRDRGPAGVAGAADRRDDLALAPAPQLEANPAQDGATSCCWIRARSSVRAVTRSGGIGVQVGDGVSQATPMLNPCPFGQGDREARAVGDAAIAVDWQRRRRERHLDVPGGEDLLDVRDVEARRNPRRRASPARRRADPRRSRTNAARSGTRSAASAWRYRASRPARRRRRSCRSCEKAQTAG